MNTVKKEKTIWEGGPSQMMNLGLYIFGALFSPLLIPILIAVYAWLKVSNTKYRITTQRFIETSGILSKKIEEVEFYRVRDYSIEIPFLYRLFGLSNIILTTSDKTHPIVYIRAIKNGEEVRDTLRGLVEEAKKVRKVSEIDIE